jgi:diacylglycerol kinase (ATP)
VPWEEWVSIAALLLALAAIAVGALVLRRLAAARRVPKPLTNLLDREDAAPGPPAFVINPIKVPDPEALRAIAREASAQAGLGEPLWFETTEEDPGGGQARRAMGEGACVVVAAGGDGTVRAVAAALTGHGVAMGLIPMGTGNLLARNLDLPIGDTRELVQVALTGRDHAVDVGFLRAQGTTDDGDHIFLVMAGIGFDAAMVAGADNELKRKVGWFAYFLAGVKHMHGRKLRVKLTVGDSPSRSLRLRTLLFANCGRLPGGIVLFPDAEIDDGWLDVAGVDTKGGVFGWASLFGQVILQGLGVRKGVPNAPGTIEFWRGKHVTVECEEPEPVQVDGDLVGEATTVDVTLREGALTIRTR